MRRSLILSAAISTMLGASFLGATGPAHGATPELRVLRAYGDSRHPGVLHVRTYSDSPITKVTTHFFLVGSPEGTPEAGSVDVFSPVGEPAEKTADWETPVHLPEHGMYRMTVDLEDASGAKATGLVASPQGVIHYRTMMRIPDLTVAPAAPDYSHQQVTVSGTLYAEPPGEPDVSVPAGGEAVDIDTGHGVITATTGADGRFSADYVPVAHVSAVFARHRSSAADPYTINAATPLTDITTVQSNTRVSVNTHTLNLAQGATGTVTGLAEIQTPLGWRPLPGAWISGTNAQGGTEIGGAFTDSQGRYTLKVPSNTPAPAGEVVLGGADDPFAAKSTQPLTVHVAFATVLNVKAGLDNRSRLHVDGSVKFQDSRGHWPAKTAVTLEYSKDGKTGWKAVATLPVTIRHNEPGVAETFTHTRTAPADGYWRTRFQGSPDLAAAVTKGVHLSRSATRITGFNASPEPVRKGDHIKVGGTVQYRSGTTWKALRDLPVSLYFKPRGAKSYRYVHALGVDGKGRFFNLERATQDGTWAVTFDDATGTGYLLSNTAADFVDVHP
ncbi:hypothetical protein ACFZAU_25145 [Streptomyces sp. NPDC008238]